MPGKSRTQIFSSRHGSYIIIEKSMNYWQVYGLFIILPCMKRIHIQPELRHLLLSFFAIIAAPSILFAAPEQKWLIEGSYTQQDSIGGELSTIYKERAREPELGSITFHYGTREQQALNLAANLSVKTQQIKGEAFQISFLRNSTESLRFGGGLFFQKTHVSGTRPGLGSLMNSPLFVHISPHLSDPNLKNTIINLELLDPFLTKNSTAFAGTGLEGIVDMEFMQFDTARFYVRGQLGAGKDTLSTFNFFRGRLAAGIRLTPGKTFIAFIEYGHEGIMLVSGKSNDYGGGNFTNPGMDGPSIRMGAGITF